MENKQIYVIVAIFLLIIVGWFVHKNNKSSDDVI